MLSPPRSLWWETLDEPVSPRPPLKEHLDVDVVIVGGGFTGLWTARELLERDPALRIAVVEQSVCGFGASGRNGGWASALFPVSDWTVAKRFGGDAVVPLHRVLNRAVSTLGEALAHEQIDGHYRQGGTLTFARSEIQSTRLQHHVSENRDRGFGDELVWLNGDEIRDRAALPSLFGATFAPHCARINPARVVRGLADRLGERGVAIYENTTVTAIEGATPTRRARIVSRGGTITANYVVRATEAFSVDLPGLRRAVAPIYSLMIATEPLPASFWESTGFRNYETFADDRHMIIYGQRTEDNRIAFGGRGAPYHFGSSIKPKFDYDDKVFELLEGTLRDLFPNLPGGISHRWGGPLAMPRDMMPSVNVDHATGLASAGGYTGDGVVLAYVAGQTLADLIVQPDSITELTSLPFVHHQSKRWPIEPARWLGINTGLALAKRSDHVEEHQGKTSRASSLLEQLLESFPP
ncbi:unannotated protein [freshwater metagenome]|uniref:Unannotated protein n=1 Tax=freshwater metagenome TaxID=449393 RepID=A0A6J7E5H2_9ZZZZ|nr:FAD-dependent oxidoreductase [Actinomycetota bacterium]MUH58576.1 FAD-dependent oxidoreductase [Actinomycetota bacterium]